jgi:hypothetical protein
MSEMLSALDPFRSQFSLRLLYYVTPGVERTPLHSTGVERTPCNACPVAQSPQIYCEPRKVDLATSLHISAEN